MEEFHTALFAGALYRTETRTYRWDAGVATTVSFSAPPTPKQLETELPRLLAEYTTARDAHTDRYRIALRAIDASTPLVLGVAEPVPADPLVFTYNDDLGISSADMYTYTLIKERIHMYANSMATGGYNCREAKWLTTLRGMESCYRILLTRRVAEAAQRRRRAALAAWGHANPRA